MRKKSAFFAHISLKSDKVKHQVNITKNGAIVSDKKVADIFSRKFAKN